MMEDHSVSVPLYMGGSSSIIMEGIGSQTSNSLDQFGSFDHNNHNRTLDGYTVVSALRGTCTNDLHAYNRAAVVETEALGTSLEQNVARDDEFREQFVGGTHISSAADANVVASRIGLQGNLTDLAVSETLIYPLEALNTCVSNDFSDGLNSSFASSMNYRCGEVFGGMNAKGDSSRVPAPLEFSANTPVRAGFQHYSPIGNPESNSWILSNSTELRGDHSYGSCNFSKELSLSLATSQPSGVNGTRIPDQCSEIGSSSISCRSLKESMVLSEGTKELSLSSGSYRTGQVSQLILGSKYLQVIQEILAQIASYSLENIDQIFSTDEIRMGANLSSSSSCAREGGSRFIGPDKYPNVDNKFEAQVSPALQKRALEAKKAQLLTLLQVVDDRYNQCLDEIHTVISAFHAATELDPQIHAHFAIRMISLLYKSLRERISNQILAMGAHFDGGGARDAEGSAESCYFQKQWTLQQLKRKDHQLWRPQRGLPEQSVSVLRSWMFQNFLHPYPKDAEKHLLAVKSGLTRSQVSNWFINARVRLWKPMIEEMYAEMNKRKALQNDDGNTNRRSHISVNNLRLKMN